MEKTLGQKISALRKAYGLTQTDLSNKLNVSRSLVSLWEKDSRTPSIEILPKLSDIFDITIDYLVGKTTVPNGKIVDVDDIHGIRDEVKILKSISYDFKIEDLESCEYSSKVDVPKRYRKKKNLFGLKMPDDSMNKVIPDNSYVFFQSCNTIKSGEIAILTIEDNPPIIRRVHEFHRSCMLEANSFNEKHENLLINEQDHKKISIIGKCLWIYMEIN